jgi:hypothetical protein
MFAMLTRKPNGLPSLLLSHPSLTHDAIRYGNNKAYNQMDAINPQEQVVITSPLTGKYEVIVSSPTTSYTTNAAVVITCHGSVFLPLLSPHSSLSDKSPLSSLSTPDS